MNFYVNGSNSLKVDSIGAVTKPNQPAFLVKASGGQQNIAINTMTEVQWNGGEIFDQNNDFASHTFTAPVTGKYQINAHVSAVLVDLSLLLMKTSTIQTIYQSLNGWLYACTL